jgi:hypothetical protein
MFSTTRAFDGNDPFMQIKEKETKDECDGNRIGHQKREEMLQHENQWNKDGN